MPLRASSHPGSPNSPSCSALAWYSCWPGLSPWGESWNRTRVARTAALTRYRYATQPNLGYPVKNAANQHFCTKSDLKVIKTIVMFLTLMLKILKVSTNVLVSISQVAALNWNDIIYPNLRWPSQKRRKLTFLQEKWHESTLDISDVPETYVEDSWGLKQRFGINQPSGRAQLKWHHIPKLRVTASKTTKIHIFAWDVNWKYFRH